jgi:hypothetical protein
MEICFDENTGGFQFSHNDSGGPNCMNYRPGMMSEMEDELNEARDGVFEQQFFTNCF